MTEINEMKKTIPHINQIEVLTKAYGSRVIAGLLGVTEQAMRLWINDPERSPRRETLKKIAELFTRHEAGEDINNAIVVDDWKEEVIKNAIDAKAMSRVTLMALAEVLAHQRSESVTKVLSELTRAVEQERASGL